MDKALREMLAGMAVQYGDEEMALAILVMERTDPSAEAWGGCAAGVVRRIADHLRDASDGLLRAETRAAAAASLAIAAQALARTAAAARRSGA